VINKTLNTPVIGAADLGYGWPKISACGKTWRQPAVVGEPRQIRDEDIHRDDVRYFVPDGDLSKVKYFIGNLAIRHSRVKYTSTGQDRAKAWITRVLLETGLALTAGNNNVNLVTGLPVDFYFKQRADFQAMLENFNTEPIYGAIEGTRNWPKAVRPWIADFHIVPQPLGAFMNLHANDQGDLIDAADARKLWLVLDFGFHTFDILVLEGLEIKPGSGSPPNLGIGEAYRLIRDELTGQLGQAPDIYTLDHYILKGLPYDGYDLAPLKEWAFNSIAAQAQNEIDSINRRFHGCIVTGGWADEMARRLKLPENTHIMDQLGNLKGYGKIGRRKWRTA